MYDVAIIGGGPAGMTAGIYAARAGLKAIIFEEKFFGGQIINSHRIDNYPALMGISGYEFANKLLSHLKEFDIDIKNSKVKEFELSGDIKILKTRKEEFKAKSVIIATGAAPRKLGIENEDKFTGLGVSYCATCDGAFYKDKKVAIVGGGNTALDDALYLSSFAKEVYLIHRRDTFRGAEITANKVKEKENIKLILNDEVTTLKGEERLNKIILKSGTSLDVDGLFVAIGNIPNTEDLKGKIELDESGFIITDSFLKTNVKMVYAAGDVIKKKLRQIVTAESDGALAVNNIMEEL